MLAITCAGARPYMSLSEAGHSADAADAAGGYERQVSGFAAPSMLSPTTSAPMTARSMQGGPDFRRCACALCVAPCVWSGGRIKSSRAAAPEQHSSPNHSWQQAAHVCHPAAVLHGGAKQSVHSHHPSSLVCRCSTKHPVLAHPRLFPACCAAASWPCWAPCGRSPPRFGAASLSRCWWSATAA